MFRIGLVDFDTSHVVQFSKRINHVGIEEEQWVEGGRVVAGFPGTSEITAPELVDQYTRQCRDECGVELVERPEDLLGRVDAVMIESQCGAAHLERARPFLEAGLPVFVDKPFANTAADATAMAELAERHHAPLFSASSLRYALEVQEVQDRLEEIGAIVGAETSTPGALHPLNPGLLHYGIHGVEILYALMGPGCREVNCVSTEAGDVATGVWDEGRIGTVRSIRKGVQPFAFTAYGEKGLVMKQIDARYIYRELLQRILTMFQTRQPPIDVQESVEMIAFIEAARHSVTQGGLPVSLSSIHG